MKTLIWQGIMHQSLEYLTLKEKNEHYAVHSNIIGCYQDQLYTVNYKINIDKDWKISEFIIESEINTVKNKMTGILRNGHWEINNAIHEEFKNFKFIDISLTPFTNTLPVKQLQLPEKGAERINVIYIDVLNLIIKPVQQQYTRISDHEYLYENLQNDFKANVLFDHNGLVTDYPKLFKKIAEI
jgi:uncharacterized protein